MHLVQRISGNLHNASSSVLNQVYETHASLSAGSADYAEHLMAARHAPGHLASWLRDQYTQHGAAWHNVHVQALSRMHTLSHAVLTHIQTVPSLALSSGAMLTSRTAEAGELAFQENPEVDALPPIAATSRPYLSEKMSIKDVLEGYGALWQQAAGIYLDDKNSRGLHATSNALPRLGGNHSIALNDCNTRLQDYKTPDASAVQTLDDARRYLDAVRAGILHILHPRRLGRKQVAKDLRAAFIVALNHKEWPIIRGDINVGADWKLHSVLTPAKLLHASLGDNYGRLGGVSSATTGSMRPVNLWKTELKDSERQTLFRAYRHGVHCAFGVQHDGERASWNQYRTKQTLEAIALDAFEAALEESSADKPVQFNVLSINLQTPDAVRQPLVCLGDRTFCERSHIDEQRAAWNAWSGATNEIVWKPNKEAAEQTSYIRPTVYSGAFGVNALALEHGQVLAGWNHVAGMNRRLLEQVIHNNTQSSLVDQWLRKNLSHPNNGYVRELKQQIMDMYHDRSYQVVGNEGYKMVTRLAVIGYMIGMQVVWNCKSGKDRTSMMDAEVKFLMARILRDKKIPEPNAELTEDDSKLLAEFTLKGGNLELQICNTGLPGYKPCNNGTVVRINNMETMQSIRGLSELVPN